MLNPRSQQFHNFMMRHTMRRELYRAVVGAAIIAAGAAACGDSGTDPGDDAPRVEVQATTNAPVPPAGQIARCYTGPDGATIAPNCPVVRWEDITYWIMEYVDGRNSLNIVAYDADENIVGQSERTGTRQMYQINVNDNQQTVTLLGFQAATAVVPWSVLQTIGGLGGE
jgi:hypothetical protein